ncbi:hypothetical protein [Paludibaculum fermentans]|uniref:Uncharacterized protein n=1 Tax=Paludibaculum fermentans TaxID=1473598 RepID=A0A7S7SI09_PALFE|nr:hypothetical protein [Paludibaculum fermentans]QOY86497.1 hypothetical protein IRI77_27390 [Paludibaculum fermentans]
MRRTTLPIPPGVIALMLLPVLLLAGTTPAGQAARIPPGSTVTVRLLDRTHIQGRLLQVRADDFDLQTARGNRLEIVTIRYADTRSLKADNPQLRRRLIGLLIAGGLFGLLIGTAATGLD